MNKKVQRYVFVYLIIALLITFDILSKIYFVGLNESGELPIILIPNLLYFTFTKNTGAALGSFSNGTIFLSIFSIIFTLVIILYDYFNKDKSFTYNVCFVLVLSGAIGNLIDRLFLGYVRDFIGMFNWYICNVADIFICLGVAIYIIYLLVLMIKSKKGKSNDTIDKN